MHTRVLVSIGIILSMQFAVCTGGILSLPSALAAELPPLEVSPPAMSYAFLGNLACSGNTEEQEDQFTGFEQFGCKDRSACLQQAHRATTERTLTFGIASVSDVAIGALSLVWNIYPKSLKPVARDGPLYEHAILLAHTIQKRE